MGNTLIPFDFNPSETKTVDNALYTVPANKHARISVLVQYAGATSFIYDFDTGGSGTETLRDGEPVSVVDSDSGTGFQPVYTVPSNYYLDAIIRSTASIRVGANAILLPGAGGTVNLKVGPGEIIYQDPAGSTSTTYIAGVLKSANPKLGEFYLKSGDEITFPGLILVQEFDNPS